MQTLQRNSATTRTQLFGVPWPEWSLSLVGLVIFATSIITYYWPLATTGLIVAAVGLPFERRRIRIPGFLWLYLAVLAYAAMGLATSINAPKSADQLIEHLKLAAIILILVNTITTRRRLIFFVYLFVGCFLLFPLRGAFFNYFIYGENLFGRAIWNHIYSNPNDLGALSLLALGATLSIVTAPMSHRFMRFALVTGAMLLLALIFMTKSRGVMLGLVVGMGPTALRFAMSKPKRLIYALVGLAVVVAFVPSTTWDRFSKMGELTSTDTLTTADPEGSAAERWEIQKTAWAIFKDHSVTGVGLGNYPTANKIYRRDLGARDTHNTYLNLAAELGLPGLILWLWLVISVLRGSKRGRTVERVAAIGLNYVWMERAFVGFLIAGLVGTYWGLTAPYLYAAMLWCSSNVDLSGASERASTAVPRR